MALNEINHILRQPVSYLICRLGMCQHCTPTWNKKRAAGYKGCYCRNTLPLTAFLLTIPCSLHSPKKVMIGAARGQSRGSISASRRQRTKKQLFYCTAELFNTQNMGNSRNSLPQIPLSPSGVSFLCNQN